MTNLGEILSAMEVADSSSGTVNAERVRQWLLSSDIDVLGAAYSFLVDPRFYKMITPPLTLDDYQTFFLKYYDRCLRENPQSDWASSRYSAGWDLANWLQGLWEQGHEDVVAKVRDWLAVLYKEADSDLKTCIINATLEHALGNRKLAKLFKGWQGDPILRTAYEEALAWSADRP
jgi:hypothetical protein